MSAYDELMENAMHVGRFDAVKGHEHVKLAPASVSKSEESTMSEVPFAEASKTARAILANDNHRRAPVYVPPIAARTHVTELMDPSDVDDLTQIGEKDGKPWLRLTSKPKTLLVYSAVPADLIAGLRRTISRDDFYAEHIQNKFSFEVVTAAKK